MSGYIVCVGDNHWVKNTSRFGAFHGCMTLTDKRHEARVWKRQRDAQRAAGVVEFRFQSYEHTKRKYPDLTDCRVTHKPAVDYQNRIGRADFFFQSDLTEERKCAIIEWVNNLPEDNYQMIRELIAERLCEEWYNQSEDA